MKSLETPIKDLLILEPKIFSDERGYFLESYNDLFFKQAEINIKFVQDNESFSNYGVLRGLHFQDGEHAQAKLIRVIEGKVLDVAVDLRKDSNTFGQHFAVELSGDNKKQFFVPRGFAHGFLTLSKTVILQYKCDNYYNKAAENGINFADPDLNIQWPININDINVNDRDRSFQFLDEFKQKL